MILSVELNRVYRRKKTMEFIIDTVDLEEILKEYEKFSIQNNPNLKSMSDPPV